MNDERSWNVTVTDPESRLQITISGCTDTDDEDFEDYDFYDGDEPLFDNGNEERAP